MMKRTFLAATLLLAGLTALAGATSDRAQSLPARFRQWLDRDAAYLIRPKEKEVFLSLNTDRERDLFIETFWKQRDPSPGTERNEFREEHYRRLAYADQHFGRGGTKPGWATDRGRIYIILGPPQQSLVYDQKTEVVPVEVWYYQGFSKYGLPDGFSCVFYKPDFAADYELYSPAADGPARLLRSADFDPADAAAAYARLLDVEPAVAQVSLSLVSGEEGGTGSSSLASQTLLNNIPLIPLRMVDDEYALRFLKYKDIVEVEYSANAIGNRATVAVIPDPSGLSFVHYAIEPERLSVEDEDGRFTTTLEVNGQVTDKQGRTVFQFERKTPVSLNREQAARLGSRPVSLQGLFPLAEGAYDLALILKNRASKEFTTVEESIIVPGRPARLAATPLLIGYGSKRETDRGGEIRAFLLGDLQLYVSPLVLFTPGDTLAAALELLGPAEERAKARSARFDIRTADGRLAARRTLELTGAAPPRTVSADLDLKGLPFGDYRLEAAVEDGSGRTLEAGSARFGLTSVSAVPRPLVFSDPLPGPDDPIHAYLVGGQYFNAGELGPAESYAGQAYRREPSSQKFAIGYGRVLLALGRFGETRDILRPLAGGAQPEASTLEFMAEASRAAGDPEEAAGAYRGYLARFGAKLSVLNGLGECYAKMGDTKNAILVWEKSLALNPDQADIKEAVAALKK